MHATARCSEDVCLSVCMFLPENNRNLVRYGKAREFPPPFQGLPNRAGVMHNFQQGVINFVILQVCHVMTHPD